MNLIPGIFVAAADGTLTFQVANQQLVVPTLVAAKYQALVNRSVVLGLRPEHTALIDCFASSLRLRGTVHDREYLGHATFCRIYAGEVSLQVAVNNGAPPATRESATVYVDMSRAHVFDASTQQALAVREP
jgi:ABC-type sugar transport system ATPase subunit